MTLICGLKTKNIETFPSIHLGIYKLKDDTLSLRYHSMKQFNALGIRVVPLAPDAVIPYGMAIFKGPHQTYGSNLEWFGEAYGFTAKSAETFKEGNNSLDIGLHILNRMTIASTFVFHFLKNNSPLIKIEDRERLSNTFLKLQREAHTSDSKEVKEIKFKGMDSNCFSVKSICPSSIYLKTKISIAVTKMKDIRLCFELNSNAPKVKVKRFKNNPNNQKYWIKELNFAFELREAKQNKKDLTGLLAPEAIIDEEIYLEKAEMDLVDGINDHHYNELQSKKIIFQITKGIAILHQDFKVAHLDLKPENILLFPDDKVGIIDFEYRRVLHSTLSVLQSRRGTFGYMPPEYYFLEEWDMYDPSKVDSWALGIILYMIIAKTSPNFVNLQCEQRTLIIGEEFCEKVEQFHLLQIVSPFEDVIKRLLVIDPAKRMSVVAALPIIEKLCLETDQEH